MGGRVVDNGVCRRPRAPLGVSRLRHDPQSCGYATRFSTGKSHGCSSIDPQAERATFTSRSPGRSPEAARIESANRLRRRGSSLWSSRSTTQDGDRRGRGAAMRPASRVRGARIPPHNLEAEESLLGSMMLSREAITAAVEAHIETGDFYKPAHGLIYEAALALHARGEPIDPVTMAEELRRAGHLEALGGSQALLRIQASTPASANSSHYAQIVSELVDVAASDRHRGRHPGDGVHERRRRRRDARPRRVVDLRGRRAARRRHAGAAAPRARADPGATRSALRPRHVDHRCADRLPRPRRAAARAAAVDAVDRRGPPGSGQDVVRARRRAELRDRRPASRCCSSRWRWATSS